MRLHSVTALALAAALLLAGCTGQQEDSDSGGGDGDNAGTQAESGIVDDDGFWTEGSLPDPLASVDLTVPVTQSNEEVSATSRAQVLSVDSDGETVRLVGAWLRPTEGASLGSRSLATGLDTHNTAPWVRLYDEHAGTIIEPLQSEETDAGTYERRSDCLCSTVSSRNEVETQQPDEVELFWLDFPAPESGEVRVMLGEYAAPTDDVPVTEGQPFDNPAPDTATFDGEPPGSYGDDAARRTVTPLSTTVRSVSGSNLSSGGNGPELSVTSDVLFDVDSSEISDAGETVLEDAAETLRDTAAGQKVLIVGHTDDQGEEAYNQTLSEERADAVEEVLADELEGDVVSLSTEGRGETEPLAPNVDGAGNPIDDNRKKNRRVSFEYDPAAGADTSIDTGEELPDAPQMEEAETAEGALASAILAQPGDRGQKTDLRFDIRGLAADGEYARMDYGFALADPADAPKATLFVGTTQLRDHLHFGVNEYGESGFPSGSRVTLIDEETGEQFLPVSAEATGCLCTEGAGTDRAAFEGTSPMFSYFPAEVLEREELTLRIADSGTWDLDVAALTGGQADSGAAGPDDASSAGSDTADDQD